jgi:hypothetical protein
MCAAMHLLLVGAFVAIGTWTAPGALAAFSVRLVGLAVALFDGLALAYLHTRTLSSPAQLTLLCGVQRALLVWPGARSTHTANTLSLAPLAPHATRSKTASLSHTDVHAWGAEPTRFLGCQARCTWSQARR